MIKNKNDLKEYLKCDAKALEKNRYFVLEFLKDPIWRFEIVLRKHEYYKNTNKKFRTFIYSLWHNKLGLKLGYSIPCNVFGKGLRINHYGLLVINPRAQIGDWCDIHMGVNIGQGDDFESVPKIGSHVWIGPGAKIFGKIHIADECVIGANSVVNKSFDKTGTRIIGIPGKAC